jgi:hypothetical protein
MRLEKNIEPNKSPEQGAWIGKEVEVYFNDASKTLNGKIVREDIGKPYKTIIELEDGKYVLATECKYSIKY